MELGQREPKGLCFGMYLVAGAQEVKVLGANVHFVGKRVLIDAIAELAW